MPKENASYECLTLIKLDPVIKAIKKYYPETLLEECKWETKKPNMENLINDDLELSSFDNETESDRVIRSLTMNNLLKFNTVF